jgi:hypothetical protein
MPTLTKTKSLILAGIMIHGLYNICFDLVAELTYLPYGVLRLHREQQPLRLWAP